MASAALNSGLIETLVSRGTTPTTARDAHISPASPIAAPGDPSPAHHAYLHAHFPGVGGFGGGGEAHDVCTSGGDATTEDDETSLNDQLSHYYKNLVDDLSASAKKRRKQSKPVRLPTPQGELGEAADRSQNKQDESQFDSEMSNPSVDGEEGLTCPHCHMSMPSDDSLRRHIIEEHIGRLLSEDEERQYHQQEQEPGERIKGEETSTPLNLSSPRWEGRPPSGLREPDARSPPTSVPMPPSFGDMKLNLPGLLPLGPPHFLLPFLQQAESERFAAGLQHHQQNSSSSSSAGNGQKRGIFNQEAYCDICSTEFCNKYFLKTHKANKHGIYSPEVSSSPPGLPSGHSTPLGPSVPLASPLGPGLPPGGLVGSPYAGAFIAANMNSFPLRPLLHNPTSPSKPPSLAKTEPSSSSSGSNSGKAGGVINMEAYCELCQKEFCNKYFLKRHKSKIHGIIIDVVTKPKAPGQPPPRVAPDRPEGWCDACRRDIGGRSALNAHKMQAHGPHIVVPLPSPHASPQSSKAQQSSAPKDSRKDGPDHRDLRDYFNPWEAFRDPREQGREVWESGREMNDVPTESRDHTRDIPVRSPWDRPIGSPWDVVTRPEVPKESPKDSIPKNESSWGEQEHRDNNTDFYNYRDARNGPVFPLIRFPENHTASQDARDLQTVREQQHREWELQRREMEHHQRLQQQLRDREQQHREQAREREHQNREQEQWKQDQELYRDQQLAREQYEQERRSKMFREDERRSLEKLVGLEKEKQGNHQPETNYNESNNQSPEPHTNEGERQILREENFPQHREELKKEFSSEDKAKEEQGTDQISEEHPRSQSRLSSEQPTSDVHQVPGPESLEGKFENIEINSENREMRPESREIKPEEREGKSEHGEKRESIDSRDTAQEGQRTPGSSSLDESSRDTGIIARVGQPAMVQAPPGTKFTPEQLRQLGVINPDAFCEICCKEFCNKYFLRTHRIKKHGIYTPEFSDRSKQHQKETSPMRLARLLERQSIDMRQALDVRPHLPKMEGELECDICHRPLQNPYLLQMHKYYFHGPGQDALHPEQMVLHPHPHPNEQLRQLAIHAQQQARQQQQHHQKRLQEHQRRLHEHQQRLLKQEEVKKEQANLERERSQSVASEEVELTRTDPARPSIAESGSSGESDASEDLRKLQSMILQLNRQGESSVRCRVCNIEVGNKYLLRVHMMTEHGILGHEEVTAPASEAAQTPKTPKVSTLKMSPPSTPMSGENQAYCNICKKDFFSRYILQQHLLSTHGVFTPPAPPTSFMERIRAEVESREERKPLSTSRSYCEICNKELCNKYFMKTHMLKMHGINVENGITGGVTCDLCNKELCSKYFLRVHKQNTHGLVEEGREGNEGIDKSEIESCPLCSCRFKNRKWLKTHLTSDHEEAGKEKWREIELTLGGEGESGGGMRGPSCPMCGLALPDVVALQLHLIKAHGNQEAPSDPVAHSPKEEASTNSLKCSLCLFTAPTPALLLAHARTHTSGMNHFPAALEQTLSCPQCAHVLPSLEAFQHHLIQHQLQGLLKPLLERECQDDESGDEKERINAPPRDDPEAHTQPAAPKRRKRWRCPQCGRKFKSRALCLAHVHSSHNPRSRGTWLGRPPAGRHLYKCRRCGAVAQRLTVLRQHIREHHRGRPGVPTSHATPTKSSAVGRFLMQPFLMNNEDGEGGGAREGTEAGRGEFVPSLVYLPVARRVHQPLTVSFSLTPA